MRATRDGETMSKYIGDYFVRRNMFLQRFLNFMGSPRVIARPYASKG